MWKVFLRFVRSLAARAWPKIQPAAELAVKRYGEEFFDLVLSVINVAQKTDKTGKEKRDLVVNHLVEQLQKSNKEVFMDTINFVIESQIPNRTK